MPLTLITGPANSGKARAVLQALRAHHGHGESPILVVPTQADVARYARELAENELVAPGARTTRFAGLLAEVCGRAGADCTPALGGVARERLLSALLARTGAARPTRGAARALAALIAELEVERVDSRRLREALDAWARVAPDHAARARALGLLYDEYLQELTRLGRADPEQRAAQALDALRAAPARWGRTPVLLYGFDDLTRLQLDAVEALGVGVGAPVTVSLTFERGRTAFAGRATTFQTLLPLASEHRELPARDTHYAAHARRALHHLERRLFEAEQAPPVPARGAVRLLEGGGERAELELVADEIAALLRDGLPPGEIAVAHRAPATIADLLGEVFRARGIPYALERRIRFADTATGRALLGLLAVAVEEDAPLGDLLAWLRSAEDPEWGDRADELELRARRAGLTDAAQGLALWESAGWPTQPLDAMRRLRAPLGRERHGHPEDGLIGRVLAELERIALAATSAGGEPWAKLVEERARRAAHAALVECDELESPLPDRPLALWPAATIDADAVIALLRGLELVVEEQPPGDPARAVAVLDPLALRARRVRALFLCGLQENVFPAPARAEPFLGEDERRSLAQASGLLALAHGPSSRDAVAAERYLLYAAVSRPEELLVLSWHDADDDGRATPRSLFVEDIRELFGGDLLGERRRRALGEIGTIDGPAECVAQIAPLRDRRVLAELRGRPHWSASALEAWLDCPVRWFVERLLGAGDLDPEPEQLARGGLAHAVLRDVLDGLRRETGSARLRPSELPRARRLLRAALTEHESRFALSVAPERVPPARRRLQADLERYLDHAAAQQSPLEPAHLELSFGFPGEPESLPALDLGDGVSVRGRIDRVDVAPGGREAVVYDYKGARAPDAGRWGRERALQVALYMRAVQESPLGLRPVGGFYQPLTGRDLRARGVLEGDSGIELDCVRGDIREPGEAQALVAEAVALAREAATEVRAGKLRARPDSCGFGGAGCAYPTICRCRS
ncbi:MAG TPA: PD-(D/E)XK nuclease family protein [Solirubrobacteraceae bacterium]|nr:PD-(D/E)XK nuclease family protein [Solirubrobacteraceae bacterium]